MFVHDIIKIKYVRLGYLKDYPPHLLADDEMCDAFIDFSSAYETYRQIHEEIGDYDSDNIDMDEVFSIWHDDTESPQFFRDFYPCGGGEFCSKDVPEKLRGYYKELVLQILYHINIFKESNLDVNVLPNWIYSYMLGEVIGPKSPTIDIHDFLVLMDVDNLYDEYNPKVAEICYNFSKDWLLRSISDDEVLKHRPPTVFGEPHVIKYLRVLDSDMILDDIQVE